MRSTLYSIVILWAGASAICTAAPPVPPSPALPVPLNDKARNQLIKLTVHEREFDSALVWGFPRGRVSFSTEASQPMDSIHHTLQDCVAGDSVMPNQFLTISPKSSGLGLRVANDFSVIVPAGFKQRMEFSSDQIESQPFPKVDSILRPEESVEASLNIVSASTNAIGLHVQMKRTVGELPLLPPFEDRVFPPVRTRTGYGYVTVRPGQTVLSSVRREKLLDRQITWIVAVSMDLVPSSDDSAVVHVPKFYPLPPQPATAPETAAAAIRSPTSHVSFTRSDIPPFGQQNLNLPAVAIVGAPSISDKEIFDIQISEMEINLARLRKFSIDWQALLKPKNSSLENELISRVLDSENLNVLLNALLSNGVAKQINNPRLVVTTGVPANLKSGGYLSIPTSPRGNDEWDTVERFVGLDVTALVEPLADGRLRVNLRYENSNTTPPTVRVGNNMEVPGIHSRSVNSQAEMEPGQSWVAMVGPTKQGEEERLWLVVVTPQPVQGGVAAQLPAVESRKEPALLPASHVVREAIPILDPVSEEPPAVIHLDPPTLRFQARLPDVYVHLNEQQLNRYLRVAITLQAEGGAEHEQQLRAVLLKEDAVIRDCLITRLSDKTLQQVRGRDALEAVRDELREAINHVLAPHYAPKIERVLFTEFLVQ